MRRIALALVAPLAAAAVLAGCGGSSGNANDAVKVTGSFNKPPTVTIPSEQASSNLVISKPVEGTGAVLKVGNAALANLEVYKWSGTTHKLVDSTFSTGPQTIPSESSLSGITTALKGARLGSRVVVVLPPKYGYGTSGNSSLGITGTDTTVWVIDLLQQQYASNQSATGPQVSNGGGALPSVTAKAGQAPSITIPKNSPPSNLSVTTLIKGSGPKLATGDTVVTQYVGYIWRTGDVFSSTWPSTDQRDWAPFSFQLGGGVLTGFSEGLAGVTVGSRVMLVIPPSLGYGSTGNSGAGIEKNDTLVFVVDVIGYLPH
jgi:FKBP-type peptidyl-prolyl cis-trans isomerase